MFCICAAKYSAYIMGTKGLGDRHMTQYWVSGPVPMTLCLSP